MPDTDTPPPDDSYPTLARALGDLARAEEREISQEAARAMLAAHLANARPRVISRLPRFVCRDGFSVSIQVGEGAYCAPRDDRGPWTAVELGFPSHPMPELADYIEDGDPATATETVWGYVPTEEVGALIARHGGAAEGHAP